jgi:hypothetical protein
LEPAIDSISADSLCSSDCGLIQTFDDESRNLIKGRMTVLESVVGCARVRAEALPTNPATVSTTTPPLGFVEAVADHVSSPGYLRVRACLVWTAERLFIASGLF